MTQLTELEFRDLTPEFGSEVIGLQPQTQLDPETCRRLRDTFDRRGLLLFRDLDIDHAQQVYLATMLIGRDHEALDTATGIPTLDDNFYISNDRPDSAAPFGRLQFHSDTMWAEGPFEVLSLYAVDVEQPAIPTTFVSGAHAWSTLPEGLRSKVVDREVLHSAGEVRRGDLSNVVLTEVASPPSTVTPIGRRHPRTGETILYICEQMTKEVVGMDPGASEELLDELFTHLYRPDHRWSHEWRNGDLLIWDNQTMQHARPNVDTSGPKRTLRKVAFPVPQLRPDQLPSYRAGD